MKPILYIPCLLVAILLSACATKKAATSSVGGAVSLTKSEKKQLLNQLAETTFQYTTYQGRAKAKVAAAGQSFNATATVRIKHNEAIWMSFSSLFSIEVARILITPEKIQIINRLQRSYLEKPFDYIYNFTGSQLPFEELENILTGNTPALAFNTDNTLVKIRNDYQITGTHAGVLFDMTFTQDALLSASVWTEKARNQRLSALYSHYQKIESNQLPAAIQLQIKTPKDALAAEINYDTVTLNEEVSQPFSVPTGYKRL